MLFSALLLATNALALDCAFEQTVLPAEGATDIATSASVHFFSPYPEDPGELFLHDAEGVAVPATPTLRQQGGNRLVVLSPDAPLAASSTYVVSVVRNGDTSVLSTFTTGAAADTAPPTGGGIAQVEARYVSEEDGDWGEERMIWVSLDEATDDDSLIYELQLDPSPGFSSPITVTSHWPSGLFGIGLCETTWSELPLDVDFHVRARAVDLSGNATDWWTAEGTAAVSESDSEGRRRCSVVPGGAVWLWPLGLLLVGRRRRG